MKAVISYKKLLDKLPRTFPRKHRDAANNLVRMVGILFARRGSYLTDSQIIPNLEYFHQRSGNNIDFFCAGYGKFGYERRDDYLDQLAVRRELRWSSGSFSSRKFNELRQEIEARTSWKYSGSADLILTNAIFNPKTQEAELDFSSAIVCNLEKMLADGAISSIESFFEDVFRFAEKAKGDDPTWGFSDKKGASLAGSALKRAILSLLPLKLGGDFAKLEHFTVRDIGKRS